MTALVRSARGGVVVALVAMLALLVAACGSDPTATPTPDLFPTDNIVAMPGVDVNEIARLYAAAKEEGEVNIVELSDVYPRLDGFTARFPGIKVTSVPTASGERTSVVIAQAQAGNVTADLVEASGGVASPLVERGLMDETVDWAGLGYSPDQIFAGMGIHSDIAILHAYNTDLVDPEDVPKTLDDFKDPRWEGKVVGHTFGFPAGIAYLGLGKTDEEVTKIATDVFNAADITLSNSPAELLGTGEFELFISAALFFTFGQQDKGAPVDWFHTPGCCGVSRIGFSVLKEAPHPNAARLFAYWVRTPEAQDALHSISNRALASGSGVDNKTSRIVASLDIPYENGDNWAERGRLTGVIIGALQDQ